MDNRPIVIFDTSGINRLLDDPDFPAFADDLISGLHVRFTFTSLSEVVATKSGERRNQLLAVCRQLIVSGDCIKPHHDIVRLTVAHFEASPLFDWTDVYVRFPLVEREIAKLEHFDDELSRQEREETRALQKKFDDLYDVAKLGFDKHFASSTTPPGSLSEFVSRLQTDGIFWSQASKLYERVAGKSADENTIRRFVAQCDPFRSLMLALCAAQYDRCVRPPSSGPSLRSGRNDTFMAVYLPYCHHFVSDDAGQLACFEAVSSISCLNVPVHSYNDFRESFFVAKSMATSAPSKTVL
jgi:hypothetical protein